MRVTSKESLSIPVRPTMSCIKDRASCGGAFAVACKRLHSRARQRTDPVMPANRHRASRPRQHLRARGNLAAERWPAVVEGCGRRRRIRRDRPRRGRQRSPVARTDARRRAPILPDTHAAGDERAHRFGPSSRHAEGGRPERQLQAAGAGHPFVCRGRKAARGAAAGALHQRRVAVRLLGRDRRARAAAGRDGRAVRVGGPGDVHHAPARGRRARGARRAEPVALAHVEPAGNVRPGQSAL